MSLPPQVLHLENHRPAEEGDIVIGAPLPRIQPTQPILAPTSSWHEIREIRENMGDELSTRRVQASSRRMISQWVRFGKPKPLRCNLNHLRVLNPISTTTTSPVWCAATPSLARGSCKLTGIRLEDVGAQGCLLPVSGFAVWLVEGLYRFHINIYVIM